MVELLAERLGAGRFVSRYGGRFAEARGPAGPVALLVPTTFMNASGDAVGPAAGTLRAAPEQVLVIHDEVDLPFGAVRGKLGGGAGGHNGVRSVMRGLGTGEFPRIRLGVGRPPDDFRGDGADWVLMRFTEPPEEVEAMIARAADMAEAALAEGIEPADQPLPRQPAGGARPRAPRARGAQDDGEPAGAEPPAGGEGPA